jgi:adenosylcobinamide-phosphate synthase
MLGHHGKYEYLGKFAARLDDVLNYIPARLTALLIVLAAYLSRKNGKTAWRTALGEHKKTESPNAGWPMAAMAGALGIRLEKVGAYIIGEWGSAPAAEATDGSLRLFQVAMLVWAAICLGVIAGMGLA